MDSRDPKNDFDQELRNHLDLEAEEQSAPGISDREAARPRSTRLRQRHNYFRRRPRRLASALCSKISGRTRATACASSAKIALSLSSPSSLSLSASAPTPPCSASPTPFSGAPCPIRIQNNSSSPAKFRAARSRLFLGHNLFNISRLAIALHRIPKFRRHLCLTSASFAMALNRSASMAWPSRMIFLT